MRILSISGVAVLLSFFATLAGVSYFKLDTIQGIIAVQSPRPVSLNIINKLTFSATVTCPDGTTGQFTISSESGESAHAFGIRARNAYNDFKAAFCR